jgi:hypothetical protein
MSDETIRATCDLPKPLWRRAKRHLAALDPGWSLQRLLLEGLTEKLDRDGAAEEASSEEETPI